MIPELLLPRVREPALILPSYVKLDMAFGVGAGSTLFDKSRYRAHGTITTATWADGAHGKCLEFTYTTPDYVTIAAAYDQLDFTSEKFSIIARVYPTYFAGNATIFARNKLIEDGYYWQIETAGRLGLFTFQGAAYQKSASSDGSIVVDTWYTVGLSRDGASVKLYINGVEDTATAGTHVDPRTCAEDAIIGYNVSRDVAPFDGRIEFLRVFGGIALPASTHLAYHNALA